jgi:hypothetical protein
MQSQQPNPNEATTPANGSCEEAGLLQKRRRMLLRVGAGSVPVTLTLASRPARAWHCNTSSAWGSAQVNPNASTTARNAQNDLVNETWTITNWKDDSSRASLGTPWDKVRVKWGLSGNASQVKRSFTVAQLFGSGSIPTGLARTDKVHKLLNDQTNTGSYRSVTVFQKYMIVAKLNAMLVPNVATCLQSFGKDQLNDMIDGTYQPSNIKTTGPWSEQTIRDYLYENWIVRP